MRYWYFFAGYCIAIMSCRVNQNKQPTSAGKQAVSSTTVATKAGDTLAAQAIDTGFLHFFDRFKEAVLMKDSFRLTGMAQFPLQTAQKWTDDELANDPGLALAGRIDRPTFLKIYGSIFTGDVLELLPKTTAENIEIILDDGAENYYRQLYAQTDDGTPIYEVYFQYPERNGTAEGYFAFVFGMVKGQHKLLSYYAKWPVHAG